MALIKCPECGRNNVCDSAEHCPECGYNIKEHFERAKRKKFFAEQKQQQELKKRQEYEKLKPELEKELNKIDNLPYPEKPNFIKSAFIDEGAQLTWVTLIALVVLFFLFPVSDIFCVLFFLLLIFWIPFWLFLIYADYKSDIHLYQNKISDWEGYKEERKNQIKRDYEDYAHNLAQYGSRTTPISTFADLNTQSNILKCPICGSIDIKRISTLNRTASVVTVGLASSKIGKQYECKKCHHKW